MSGAASSRRWWEVSTTSVRSTFRHRPSDAITGNLVDTERAALSRGGDIGEANAWLHRLQQPARLRRLRTQLARHRSADVHAVRAADRSEERRVGKEWVSQG